MESLRETYHNSVFLLACIIGLIDIHITIGFILGWQGIALVFAQFMKRSGTKIAIWDYKIININPIHDFFLLRDYDLVH